jgi:hypothetical protein
VIESRRVANCNQQLCIELWSVINFHREIEPANLLQYLQANADISMQMQQLLREPIIHFLQQNRLSSDFNYGNNAMHYAKQPRH